MTDPSFVPSLVKKRRRRHHSPSGVENEASPFPVIIGVWGVLLLAVFSAGAPLQLSSGILYLSAGLLMCASPPRVRLPWFLYACAGAYLLFAASCFLPASWLPVSSWRESLEKAGLNFGPFLTAHPRQSLAFLMADAVSLVVIFYILSLKIQGKRVYLMTLLFALGVAVYAAISILFARMKWNMAWQPVETFGFFPNRNHTATLLAMGIVTGAAALFHGVKNRRGGYAGLAALSLVICLLGIGGFSVSRAGLLLTGGGLGAWVMFLGRKWISPRFLIPLGVFALIAIGVFWMTDNGLKNRLTTALAPPAAVRTGADDVARTSTREGEVFDFRVLIYRDALTMAAGEPLTGCGIGMFGDVFPQYRHSSSTANNSMPVHPESDWLLVLTESGVPALLAAVAGVVFLLVTSPRGLRGRDSWPLRLGCFIAAVLVPVHGLFDMPGHRAGLAWSAVFLLALVRRDAGDRPMSPVAGTWIWRFAGLAVCAAGALSLWAEAAGENLFGSPVPRDIAPKVKRSYQQDMKDLADGGSRVADGDEARVKIVIGHLDRAIEATPLDAELHFLRGTLSTLVKGRKKDADRDFLIQRMLDPTWVRLPLRQAASWTNIDANRAATLWQEAMDRAARLEELAPATYMSRGQVFHEIMDQAADSEGLSLRALKLTGGDTDWMMLWANRCHPSALNVTLPDILEAPETAENPRGPLFDLWHRRDRSAADRWVAAWHGPSGDRPGLATPVPPGKTASRSPDRDPEDR